MSFANCIFHPRQLWRVLPLLMMAAAGWAGHMALGLLSHRNVAFGDIAPSGDAVVVYIGNEQEILATHVRSTATGDVIHDISSVKWNPGYPVRWSADGRTLLGVAYRESVPQIIELRITPAVTIIRQEETTQHIAAVLYDSDGRVVRVENITETDASRPQIRILEGASLRLRQEYGRDESIHIYTSDHNSINVSAYPNAGPPGDFVLTQGVQPNLLQFDPTTGNQIAVVNREVAHLQHNLMSVYNRVTGVQDILGKNDEAIRSIPATENVVYLDKERCITWNVQDRPGDTITVYSLTSQRRKEFELDELNDVVLAADNNLLLATNNGRIQNLDIESGRVGLLLNARPNLAIYSAVAFGGLVLSWITWLSVAYRCRPVAPLFDLSLICFASGVLFLFWYRAAELGERDFLSAGAALLFSAMLFLVLVWTTTSASFWGRALPTIFVVLSCVIATVVVLFTDDEAAWILVSGGLWFLWQSLVVTAFQSFVGFSTDDCYEQPRSHRQITLGQVAVGVTTICMFLSTVRFIVWHRVVEASFPTPHFIWLNTFLIMYAAVALLGLWSAFRIPSMAGGLKAFLCVAAPALVTHYFGTVRFGFVFDESAMPWCFVFIGGLGIFIMMRYCRACGYTMMSPASKHLPSAQ